MLADDHLLSIIFYFLLSSDGEKEERDESLDLRRTESDSVLKKVCVCACVRARLRACVHASLIAPDRYWPNRVILVSMYMLSNMCNMKYFF